jgi:sugar phosphate isomerase/epimerase
LLSQFSLDDVLTKLERHTIRTVELGTGNYPGDAHCKLAMLDDAAALQKFKDKVENRGFAMSALSCHGNPLHQWSSMDRNGQGTPACTPGKDGPVCSL